MNANKKPPQRGVKDGCKTRAWLRRGLLAALVVTACVLLWAQSAQSPGAPSAQPTASPHPSAPLQTQTPAPTQDAAHAERTAREAAYDKDVAALTALLQSGAADEPTRAQAAQRLEQLVGDHQTELGLEDALQKAGFAPCVVLLQNGALTVVVSGQMSAEQSAAILSLCVAHSDVAAENIRIMAREAT